ncbi:deacylase [Cupriavidus sp. USMAA2-4]|uniref:Deacylase n=1 Tax=Cupriavidus malaysiensis TaxID=367825 RepID=A0ABM6F9M1_9BURK|nr:MULTISPECIES: YbaK/EbsC family protein [Cupriavidus]AOY95200.1 deacylase [Cupriavidus sp. USMAA2-4]AOZ01901.1 deacylase [Cupriavidus sp. USMAHM13]AOZ08363.1 deacylase [Cupriavidus malaysiensis]
MALAGTLAHCLTDRHSPYDLLHHPYTLSSMATAEAAHVPGDRLAKTLLLEDSQGYVAAVIPASHHLQIAALCEQTGRDLVLAHEDEIREVFKDCELGAIPPVAMAYGMRTYMDDTLLKHPDVYFESGNHQDLVHMSMDAFLDLMGEAEIGHFARRMM